MNDYREIINKFTAQAQDILRGHMVKAILYGSYARGDYWLGALPFYDNINRDGVVLRG